MKQIIVLLLASLAPLGSLNAQYNIGKGDVQDLYLENCVACHGENMAGGSGGSLVDGEWLHGSGDDDIARVIREGVDGTEMPAWGETFSDEQIRSLVILIREQRQLAGGQGAPAASVGDDAVHTAAGHAFTLEEIGQGEGILWSLAFLPDGGLLVTQRDGALWHFRDGERTAIEGTPEVWQHGQGGLLEVALHPDFENNGWIYLSYSEHTGGMDGERKTGMTTVVRGRIDQGRWSDQENLIRFDEALHNATGAHFGSRFVFDDGYLFFSVGDRGRQEQAQDLDRPNGKIHRIHDDGRIPADNPFVDTPGALPSIWSYGHRNPQGLDQDPFTGLLWEAEHGPRGGDEINVIEKGRNYGWPVITYGMNYNGTPITSETHREGMEQPRHYWVPSIAVAGIDVYEGDAFPSWKGKMLVGGMASNELHLLTLEDGQVTADEILMTGAGRIRDVASGPDGFVYLLLNSDSPKSGRVVRLRPAEG